MLWWAAPALLLAAGRAAQLSDTAPHPLAAATNTTESSDSLEAVFSEYHAWLLRSYPEWATLEGVSGYNHLVEDFSMAAIRAKVDTCRAFLERSRSLVAETSAFRAYQNYFEAEVLPCVEGFQYKGYLFPPVNKMENIAHDYPQLVARARLDSVRDYEDLLARLRKLPAMLRQITALLRLGIKEGVTFAKESLAGVDERFEALQVAAQDSIFYSRFRDMSGSLGRRVVGRLQAAAFNLTEAELLPAFRDLQLFLRHEYSPQLRASPGISAVPGGAEVYRAALRLHLGSDISPQEIHDIGTEEVARLKQGAIAVIKELGQNMTFREFSNYLLNDESQQFSSKSEALDFYESKIKNINTKLPLLFPDDILTDEVRGVRVEASTGAGLAYYEAGVFHVRLEPLSSQTRFEALTLALHETNPGHHLQYTVAGQQHGLPDFIKRPLFHRYTEVPSRVGMPTVSVEGWGLYSEWLGFELGLYAEDPIAKFGSYSLNLLRAARLVVDTGLHALGWSRQRALDYLVENTPASREVLAQEVDRYITMPGQATAYKIGERAIKAVRAAAEARLGPQFSVREFHRVVVTCPGPRPVLQRCVDTWAAHVAAGHGASHLDYSFDEAAAGGAGAASLATVAAVVAGVAALLLW